jgi:hypothetical protein
MGILSELTRRAMQEEALREAIGEELLGLPKAMSRAEENP